MANLDVEDFKVFLPAKDFAVSKAFYTELGANVLFAVGAVAEFEFAGSRFILQDRYQKDWAEHCMVHLRVTDAAAWAGHVSALAESGAFPGVRVEGPRDESWGYRVTYVWDPSGVLLQFSQPMPKAS